MRAGCIYLAAFLLGAVYPTVVPFRDSVEIVFTPEDIRKGTDYILWKVPTVKNNFKTTVKQKLLNRLLSKDLQELRLNSPYQDGSSLVSNGEVHSVATTNNVKEQEVAPLRNIQLEVEKPKGLVNSVLKGPSETEKTLGRVRYVDEKKDITRQALDLSDNHAKEKVVQQVQKETNEHVGYSKPSNIKNRKHNFDVSHRSPNEEESEEGGEYFRK
ncbi:hypothetical protein KGF57_004047 [Candida theae]|uniref:Uncharacterized protein n=1 Tax=Candida theae TaxID=1198502 RepID=A0AAD5BBZ4_9ASCO|nr:uncharacterized protein KGF57_004047 [Candida theae]KAI5953055.1 hypothetical protein KGF57_004047 [Candida theae]